MAIIFEPFLYLPLQTLYICFHSLWYNTVLYVNFKGKETRHAKLNPLHPVGDHRHASDKVSLSVLILGTLSY